MRATTTSNRIRRHDPEPGSVSRPKGSWAIDPAPPPVPDKPPRPLGELATAAAEEIVALAGECFGASRGPATNSRRGMRWLLEHLADIAGPTWHQRWESAGLNDPGRPVGDLAPR